MLPNTEQCHDGREAQLTGGPEPIPGNPKSISTYVTDLGAAVLQARKPIGKIHQHICAFHAYAHDASRAVHSHHFCACMNDEMRQCIIYDSDASDARLIGVEYIISARLFEGLPAEEKKFWHSHVYEVKSGELQIQNVPGPAEDLEMSKIIGTYGKIWHFWQVDRGDPLPYGPPQLMMAFTADGQLDPEVLKARDEQHGLNTEKTKERRKDMPIPEIDPAADHPWHTGRAWQCTMEEVPFTRPKVLHSDGQGTKVIKKVQGQSAPSGLAAAPAGASVGHGGGSGIEAAKKVGSSGDAEAGEAAHVSDIE